MKDKLSLIVFIIVIIAILGAGLYMARKPITQVYESYKADTVLEKMKDGTQGKPSKKYRKYAKTNKDMKYILSVDKTEIDYPVVSAKRKGNQFYLHHNLKGDYSFPGTLFINKDTPQGSQIMVIHGHNMRSGTLMFHDLRYYKSKKYAKKHKWARLYDGQNKSFYKLAYAIITPGSQERFAYINKGFGGDVKAYKAYMDELNARAVYKSGKEKYAFGIDDKVIALSTCIYDIPDGRMVVYFKKVDKDDNGKPVNNAVITVNRSFSKTVNDIALKVFLSLICLFIILIIRKIIIAVKRGRDHD